MRRLTACMAVAGVAVAAALAGPLGLAPALDAARRQGPVKSPLKKPLVKMGAPKVSKGDTPSFEVEGYTLSLAKLEAHSRVDLAEHGEREHTIQLAGRITAPKEQDAVAVTKELAVAAISDANDRSLLELKAPPKFAGFGVARPAVSNQPQEYRQDTFRTLQDGAAEVEVPQVKLRRSPYTIAKMELKATVILAEQREEKTLPAIVMEEPAEIAEGVRVRVTALKMTATRELTIEAKCDRPRGGPSGAFIEQVWVLDENNERIAGGRWTRGDPFGRSVGLTAKLALSKEKVHKNLVLVLCTKYSRKTLRFDVQGIFQK